MVKKNEIIEVLLDYIPPMDIEQYLNNKEMFRKAIEEIDSRAREDAGYKLGFFEFIKIKLKNFSMKRNATIIE